MIETPESLSEERRIQKRIEQDAKRVEDEILSSRVIRDDDPCAVILTTLRDGGQRWLTCSMDINQAADTAGKLMENSNVLRFRIVLGGTHIHGGNTTGGDMDPRKLISALEMMQGDPDNG